MENYEILKKEIEERHKYMEAYTVLMDKKN